MNGFDLPVVSVVVPVYNVEAYLPQCLESLTAQTLEQIEILCVDDGSADGSVGLVREFQEKDSRVVLLQQDHQGVSAARNRGIEAARGAYIAFLDSDDWVREDMLESLVAAARRAEADVAVCSSQVHFEGPTPKKRMESLTRALTVREDKVLCNTADAFAWTVLEEPGAWPFIWNKVIRADLLRQEKIRYPEGLALGEDGVFLQILFQYARKVAFLAQPMHHYRYQRKDSATDRLYQEGLVRFERHLQVVNALAGELHRRGRMERNGPYLREWTTQFLYGDFMALPAGSHGRASHQFRQIAQRWDLAAQTASRSRAAEKRFRKLLETKREYSQLRRSWSILLMKVENRLLRLLK